MRSATTIAADLLALLLATCPAYRQRRANPPASPAFDVTDYTHLCWDFAAHAAELVEGGRAAELVDAFAALETFHEAAREAWMKPGPVTVFERLVSLCHGRGADLDALVPFLTAGQRRLLDGVRNPDGHPYPIDGRW